MALAEVAHTLNHHRSRHALFGTVAHLGATQARHGVGTAFAMEIVLSWLLITVIIGTATRHRLIGPNAAIAVGVLAAIPILVIGPGGGFSISIAATGLIYGNRTGAAMGGGIQSWDTYGILIQSIG